MEGPESNEMNRQRMTTGRENYGFESGSQKLFEPGPFIFNVDFHSLAIQSIAGQGHIVFPTDQAANPTTWGIDHIQTQAIAKAPHHPLRVGRHELTVAIENFAVRAYEHVAVVQGGPAELAVTLIDSAQNSNTMPTCRFT